MSDAPIQVCTAAGIIDKFGGIEKLNEAIDQHSTGVLAQAILDTAVIDASADVEAAVGQRYLIWGNDPTGFPRKIVRMAEMLGVKYVWYSATGGRAVPEGVRKEAADITAELAQIGKGEISPGSPRPKSRLFPREIDNSDGGTRAVYSVWLRAGSLGSR